MYTAPEFPEQNLEIMSKFILKIVRFYETEKELFTKINMCWAMQIGGSLLLKTHAFLQDKNKRSTEIKELNIQLYELGQKISGKDVQINAEFINVENHEFHRDSQFLVF